MLNSDEIFYIFEFLDWRTLLRSSFVCKGWNLIVNDIKNRKPFWNKIMVAKLTKLATSSSPLLHLQINTNPDDTYKEYLIMRNEFEY